jgi:hypothetical protein
VLASMVLDIWELLFRYAPRTDEVAPPRQAARTFFEAEDV